VTEWKALLMQMDEYELTFADPMLVVMFLQTLPSKFHQFKTYQMMQPTITSEKLYRDVVEFDRANFNKDEADNQGVALEVEALKPCRFGTNCWNWAAGTCNKFHPSPQQGQQASWGGKGGGGKGKGKGSYKVAEAKGKGKGKGGGVSSKPGWTCNKCSTWNYGDRDKCFKCSISKYEHGAAGSAVSKKMKRKQQDDDESGQAASDMRAMKKRLMTMTKKAEALGLDIESDFVAQEQSDETAMATLENQLVFKIDSGASSHFGGNEVPITEVKACDTRVEIADGNIINVTRKGNFTGVISGSTGAKLDFEVKQNPAFVHNLFSVKQATKDGCRVVFDSEGSYIEQKITGVKTDLLPDQNGWNIIVDKGVREGSAYDGTTIEDDNTRKINELYDLVTSVL
jgi:hypothetical protein